jgi:hypothetical protein
LAPEWVVSAPVQALEPVGQERVWGLVEQAARVLVLVVAWGLGLARVLE